ncbi:MAG: hypothetical protein COB69_05335 [Phycisphaera sp.]|nr:MAG: hypothetical protein COB69_05335 [Phycisphaera sp.]
MDNSSETKAITITRWAAKIVTAGIFTVGGFIPKVTGNAGPLVETVPGGQNAVYAIAVVEIVTIVLILNPKTAFFGGVLAVVTMLGAIASHFGPVGMEGDMMTAFGMAIVALAAATTATVLEWKRAKSR